MPFSLIKRSSKRSMRFMSFDCRPRAASGRAAAPHPAAMKSRRLHRADHNLVDAGGENPLAQKEPFGRVHQLFAAKFCRLGARPRQLARRGRSKRLVLA